MMRAMRLLKRIGYLVGFLALAAIAFVAWVKFGPRSVPSGQPELVTLSGSKLQVLRDDFNQHRGEVRILALLSPT